ncbi:hypothetical protein [Paraferrimonas haliotis]|uniref:Uncharacterized protein n=1 Tax=Paraferrimonas haliotis TaxID=2013866 RepID=A0AA37TYG5_9GAMM|nr:hypothetical protein [Paraferrimonas haliotis]GLS84595.1 hypothetical protein GCM10007894_25720 [Paraferrimonas haliotis]
MDSSNNVIEEGVAMRSIDPSKPVKLSTPIEALSQLSHLPKSTPIVVDFDETLWLRNSVEQFLSSARPNLWVAIILQLLGLIRPWDWFNSINPDHIRDKIRIGAVLLLAPWTLFFWPKTAKKRVNECLNSALVETLRRFDKVYIASYSFGFIITPLVAASNVPWPVVVSADFGNYRTLRLLGKGSIVEKNIGEEELANSATISDSRLDNDLFRKSKYPLLVKWPTAVNIPAGRTPLLPFSYLKRVKRPNESYFTRAIIGHDYLVLLLAFACYSAEPFLTALALFLFLLSYFTAYEIGYYENDKLGLQYEENPKVSDGYKRYAPHFSVVYAWIFSLILAIPASVTLALANNGSAAPMSVLIIFASFTGLLISVRLMFAWFNRLPVQGRILPMLLLQLARSCGYLVIVTTGTVGVAFCISQALSKWIPYVVYRFGGSRRDIPNHLINVIALAILLAFAGLSGALELTRLLEWQSILIISYCLLRAAKDVYKFRKQLQLMR